MRILLTGASGFIGSAFAAEALARGHQVGLLTRDPANLHPKIADAPASTVLVGDLANPPWPAIEKFNPESCVHAAWITTPGVYLESPLNRDFRDWSRTFLSRLAESGTAHLCALGTCIEYAPSAEPLVEERSPLEPRSLYARCKIDLHESLAALPGRPPVTWGRVFYPYGPGEHPDRLLSAAIRKLRAGESVELKTPASRKDYIHIDDLARGILTAVEARFDGPLNLGTGATATVAGLVGLAARELGVDPGRVRDAPELASDPYPHVCADASRLRALGWEPRIRLTEGVPELIASIV